MLAPIALALLACGDAAHAGFVYEYEDDPVPSALIPVTRDLQSDGAESGSRAVPLLVAFSTPWCTYCDALEREVLEPMLRHPGYADRVLVRKVVVSDADFVRDFSGREVSTLDFGNRVRVELFPTIVLFDSAGRERGRRIVGITVLEFVADRIDRSIALALEQIRGREGAGSGLYQDRSLLRTSGR